jgi:multiple sugar transport system permease protein
MERTGQLIEVQPTPSIRRRRSLAPWLFVTPTLMLIVVVTIFPTIYTLGLSFFKWEATLKNKPFIGLGNYIQLFKDDRFINSIGITLFLVIIGVFLELVLGFAFANFLTKATASAIL